MSGSRWRTPPSPARALGVALTAAGAGITLVNLRAPDESRAIGLAVLAVGLLAGAAPDGPRLRGLGALAAATLLVLAGGECAVRHENARAQALFVDQLVHFVPDPVLRYELKPSVSCGQTTTNELGMVDGPRAVPKPAGTLRVACLGDSVGADCNLPGQTACPVLEEILRERRGGRPTEVLNFSAFGYNAMQEARTLEVKASAFQPDAVVVLYVVNDPYPDLAITHFLPGHFKFEHLLFSGARTVAARALSAHLALLPEIRELYDRADAWDGVVVTAFDRIARAASTLGAPVVVAVFPLFTDPWTSSYDGIYAKVTAEAERHGLIGVDLSHAAYAGVAPSALLKPSRDAIHPNAFAHRLAARAVADALAAAAPGLLR